MAIKDLIARGIGFTPGSVKFIVTHGLSIGLGPSITSTVSLNNPVDAQLESPVLDVIVIKPD